MTDRVKIKICGVKTPEVAVAAVNAGADMVGVVFAEKSPRFVTSEQAREVVKALKGELPWAPPEVHSLPPTSLEGVVGLFVDGKEDEIKKCVDAVGLDVVQLHGEGCAKLIKALAPICVIRAMSFDINTAKEKLIQWNQAYGESENFMALLIDTPDPSKIGGGTGVSFDWSQLRGVLDEVNPDVPIILAGGLNAANVGKAIEIVKPFGVDVSSGVESSRGVKDIDKVKEFCRAVRDVGG